MATTPQKSEAKGSIILNKKNEHGKFPKYLFEFLTYNPTKRILRLYWNKSVLGEYPLENIWKFNDQDISKMEVTAKEALIQKVLDKQTGQQYYAADPNFK
jgi:hypothetical protein